MICLCGFLFAKSVAVNALVGSRIMIAEPHFHPGDLNLMRKVSLSGAMIECIRLQWEGKRMLRKG